MASYTGITNILDFAVAFNPSTAFPLDARSMFGSKAAAEAAAATAQNAGSSSTVYYFGMPLTVFENDEATMYVINGDGTLKEVGKATYGDGKTITLSADTGALSLKSFGEEYYAYHSADTVLDSTGCTYPDAMPEGAAAGDYTQIDSVWYTYDGTAWAEAAAAPITTAYYELVTGWKEGLEPKVVGNSADGYALAWYEPSSTTIEGINSIVSSLQTTVEGMNDRVTNNTNAINVLNGDETVEGSVKQQVTAKVAEIIAGAGEDFDTLKEIEDWISNHGSDAAAMNSSITANATAIAALQSLVGELPEGTQATTVIEYIAEAINAAVADIDTGVMEVTAGDNGYVNVDGTPVKVYEAPIANTTTPGDVKPDGTSITVDENGTISVGAVDVAKVTGLDEKITNELDTLENQLRSDVGDEYVAKSDVATATTLQTDAEQASDTKVPSEKAFVSALTWKTTM